MFDCRTQIVCFHTLMFYQRYSQSISIESKILESFDYYTLRNGIRVVEGIFVQRLT